MDKGTLSPHFPTLPLLLHHNFFSYLCFSILLPVNAESREPVGSRVVVLRRGRGSPSRAQTVGTVEMVTNVWGPGARTDFRT